MPALELKRFHSIDLPGLDDKPDDPKEGRILVSAEIGFEGSAGADRFDFHVCSVRWVQKQLQRESHLVGRGLIVVNEFEWKLVENAIRELVERIRVETWDQAATALSRFAFWEFEGRAPPSKGD